MTEEKARLFFREVNLRHGCCQAQGIAVGWDSKELDALVRLIEGAASLQGAVYMLASTLDMVCDINNMSRPQISKYALELIERIRTGVVE